MMNVQIQGLIKKRRISSKALRSGYISNNKNQDKNMLKPILTPEITIKKNLSLVTNNVEIKNKEDKFRLQLMSLTKKPRKNSQADIRIKLQHHEVIEKKKITNLQQNKQKTKEMTDNVQQQVQKNEKNVVVDIRRNRNNLQNIQRKYQVDADAKTKAGSTGKTTKTNQDRFLIDQNLPHGVKMYLVCDGHGANGHYVSEFIKQILHSNLYFQPRENLHTLLKKCIHLDTINIIQILKDSFKKTNDALLSSDINTELSGSTVIGVFLYGSHLYCLNVGDSRAILGCRKKQQWVVKALSDDHKPQRPDQRKRILKYGGLIEKQRDEMGRQIGIERVWRKDLKLPGLAMTRSFGDKAGMKAGTCGQPEVLVHTISESDKFIVVASDGVWQYLDNDSVMKIVEPCYAQRLIELGARTIIDKACNEWQNDCFSRDDITAIVVFLQHGQV